MINLKYIASHESSKQQLSSTDGFTRNFKQNQYNE